MQWAASAAICRISRAPLRSPQLKECWHAGGRRCCDLSHSFLGCTLPLAKNLVAPTPERRANRTCEVLGKDLSGNLGGLNGSTQHSLEVHYHESKRLKSSACVMQRKHHPG